MEIKAFRVQMYRCILDSDWIEVTPLTVVVGKNEAGKTTLLRALHKFNPFKPEPYSIDHEWPRGHRKERNDKQVVCAVRFELSPEEIAELAKITDQPLDNNSLRTCFRTISIRTTLTKYAHPCPNFKNQSKPNSKRRQKNWQRRPDVWLTTPCSSR